MLWRAYYTEGRTFDSDEYDWGELPDEGIVGVRLIDERQTVQGGDWFWLEDGVPTCGDTHPEWGKWLDPPDVPASELKRGEAMPDDEWDALKTEMTGT